MTIGRDGTMALRSLVVALVLLAYPLSASAQSVYFPGANWEHKTPADSGLNPALLKEAIDFAVANETKNPRDLVMNHYQTFGREPFGYAIGPIRERGEPSPDRSSRLCGRRVG